jgi:hypothetical protein
MRHNLHLFLSCSTFNNWLTNGWWIVHNLVSQVLPAVSRFITFHSSFKSCLEKDSWEGEFTLRRDSWVSEPSRRLTLDLWLAKDNRFLNLKSSYKLVLSVQKVDQQGHEGEGKVLRVLLSGRWLPRNQGWLNFWETKLVTVRKSLHRSCWTELTCQGILLP